jgi:LacI family transcriptional regulator
MTRRPTVRDVAARAGVSIKTVSQVVNASSSVSDAVRVRVTTAIEELHYVPNSWARSLKVGTGDTIGVVIDTIGDPFFAALTSAVENRALQAGLNVVFGSTGFDTAREQRQVERMAMQQVRALLLAPVTGDHGYFVPYRSSFPTVLIDRGFETDGYDVVLVDDYGATRDAVQHLLRHGHRRIAFLGADTRFPTTMQRLAGYRDAMAQAGVEPRPAWAPAAPAESREVEAATRALLGGGGAAGGDEVTALLAANTRAGIGAVHALHSLGRTDVAMVGFGDFPLAGTLRPGVTVVDQDPHRIGETATERLIARIDGTVTGPGEELIVPTELLERGSGELAPTSGAAG